MTDAAEIQKLTEAIWKLHGATGKHRESVPIREMFRGQIAWNGIVEVFDLEGHPSAKVAYAWSHEGDSGGRRYVVVLGIGPVVSPKTAVQAAIIRESQERTK